MIDEYAFCPRSGAPLSEERHYDERGQARRVPEEPNDEPTIEELTNGERRSSRRALLAHFRHCHARHADPDPALYRAVSLALYRLKRAADGTDEWDVYVWYALAERLAREGFDAGWMHVHVEPRCPRCHGKLKYGRTPRGDLTARCGARCSNDRANALREVRETVADLYTRAFEPPEPVEVNDLATFD